MLLRQKDAKEVSENISIRNMLLRGCILRNTSSVFGAVMSTGTDTKVEYGAAKKPWWDVKVGERELWSL